MSTITAPTADFGDLKKALGGSVVISMLMIVAGVLAIVVPAAAGIAVTVLVGWLMMFTGAAHLAYAWHTRSGGNQLWEILLGAVYILAGIYVVLNPVVGLATLTAVLGVYLLVESILEFVLAFRLHLLPGSGWLTVDGIITLILALVIWRTWPTSSAWAIGMLVGISMLFSGIARLMLSWAARRVVAA